MLLQIPRAFNLIMQVDTMVLLPALTAWVHENGVPTMAETQMIISWESLLINTETCALQECRPAQIIFLLQAHGKKTIIQAGRMEYLQNLRLMGRDYGLPIMVI